MRDIPPRRFEYLPPPADAESDMVYAPAREEPQLRDYLRTLLKRRRLLILVVATMLVLGVLISAMTTPLYTAQVTIKIDKLPSVAGFGDMTAGAADYFQTQLALLKSRALAARVITDLDLASNPNFVVVQAPTDWLRAQVVRPLVSSVRYISDQLSGFSATAPMAEAPQPSRQAERGVHPNLINRYLRLLDVKAVTGTSLAAVQFTTISPRLSEEMAAAHAAAFIRMNLETRFELTNEARDFLQSKLAEVKVKVERSEEALQRFRQKHRVVSLDGSQNIVVDRMVDLNRRLTEARARRIELESLERIVKDQNFEYLSQIIGNNLILQLKGRLEGLEAEQARLATIFKRGHPRLMELNQQVNEARRRLRLEIGNVVRGIESDYAAARAREAALQAEAERQHQAALDLKEVGVEFTLLQGELDANRAVYDSVAKRLNETTISNDSPISNIQIAEPAERPLGPSSPLILRNLMMAAALGLLFGVGLVFFVEHFDSSLYTPDDVWRAVAVPTLGVVPHLKSLARREYRMGRLQPGSSLRRLAQRWGGNGHSPAPGLMVVHHPLSFLAESFRTIRTVLLLGQAEKPPRMIVVTSAHPGEGKTTVTLNLALAMAQAGRSVVVVDADLRKGNTHAQLDMPNRYGLTHILADGLPLEQCLRSTDVAGLSLLSRGSVPPNATDLLASDRMQEVVATLRERFDFVFIDTPPSIVISDAAVLSVLSDAVLVVLRNQSTTADAARRVIDHLQAVGAPILGVVLNGIDIRNAYYSDYRKYYSSYYAQAQQGTSAGH